MALTDKLTAIADAIRGKTGKTAEMTLDQMAAEISGMEAGGGAGGIYMAKVTPASNATSIDVPHNLGSTDILLATIFAETLDGITPTANATMGRFFAKTDIPFRYSASASGENYQMSSSYLVSSGSNNASGAQNDDQCCIAVDQNTFRFVSTSGSWPFWAGVTYTVIVVAASAFAEV